MKHHEYRELVNTLTKIAREYGQTQQLRERIAYALPLDCDLIDAPSVEGARKMGEVGGPAVDSERIAFEAWMEGNFWTIYATWDGKQYATAEEAASRGRYTSQDAMRMRMMWAAWRDRAALSKLQSVKIPANPAESQQ